MNGTHPAIEQYLEHLAGHLSGSSRRRRGILDEVTDGLLSALEERLEQGADPGKAAREVVRDWGSASEIASAYNEATLRFSAWQLTSRAVLLIPVLAGTWGAALLAGPPGPWGYLPAAVRIGLFGITMGVAACLAGGVSRMRTGRGVRAATRGADTPRTGTVIAITGLLVTLASLFGMLLNRGLTHPESLAWWLIAVPASLSLGSALYFLTALRRFLLAVHAAEDEDPAYP